MGGNLSGGNMVLHVLGHVHLTRQGQTVPVSSKAAALLTYLCLEGLAHHREHLAELLWNTPDPLRNLRVELARLKRDDVAHFPDRQPMLSFQVPLDLTGWLSAAAEVQGDQMLPWLSRLRGLPLSGLEDLGSRRYQQWLEVQRWAIIEQVERALGEVRQRLAGAGRLAQARQIQARAEQLGLHLPGTEVDGAGPHGSGLHGAGLPSSGPHGSGPNSAHGLEVSHAGSGENDVATDRADSTVQLHSTAQAGMDAAQPRLDPAQRGPGHREAAPAAAPRWECVWEERRLFTELMERATSPHLVLLCGRSGSGKRTLLRQSVVGSGWQLIQLQAPAQQTLFQEALAQRLNQLLATQPIPAQLMSAQPRPAQGANSLAAGSPSGSRPLWQGDTFRHGSTGNTDDGLIELAGTLHRSGLKVMIAVHNALLAQSWLAGLARFLLDLPLPLILVLSETLPARLDAVGGQLAFADAQRVTRFQMPLLTTRTVLRAWETLPAPADEALSQRPQTQQLQTQQTQDTRDQTLTRAAALIQRSEGWPLHAQALYQEALHLEAQARPVPTQSAQVQFVQDQPVQARHKPLPQVELPESVRNVLLAEVALLPAHVRHLLARLSLVHTRFDHELAELLAGPPNDDVRPDVSQTLVYAAQQGVLVPAAGHEHVVLPDLHYRSDDQTRWLRFGSEAMRVALAGSLTGLERQEVRQRLAHFFLARCPALSLHYARKAGLEVVAAQALAAQRKTEQHAPEQSPAGQDFAARASALEGLHRSGAVRAAPPGPVGDLRRELRTPNGYRVALDGGYLEVTRCGCYGPPPLLTLSATEVPAGSWSLTARADVFRAAPELGTHPAAYVLGLRSGPGPRTVYTLGRAGSESAYQTEEAEEDGGNLPAGEWFTLQGAGGGGTLELSVRALDVAFTVAELNWGGVRVLPVHG